MIVTGTRSPTRVRGAGDMHRLQVGRAADELARVAARPLEQHWQRAADAVPALNAAACCFEQRLQLVQPLRLRPAPATCRAGRCRRAGPGAVLERIGLGEADLLDQAQRRREVRVGLAGKTDDEVGRQRDVRPRRAQARRPRADSRRPCSGGSSPRAPRPSPTAPADAGTASAAARRHARRSGRRPCRADARSCSGAARGPAISASAAISRARPQLAARPGRRRDRR